MDGVVGRKRGEDGAANLKPFFPLSFIGSNLGFSEEGVCCGSVPASLLLLIDRRLNQSWSSSHFKVIDLY